MAVPSMYNNRDWVKPEAPHEFRFTFEWPWRLQYVL
jgi:hypothetical protein